MIESYPEADRYWVVSGSELLGGTRPVHDIAASDPQMQALIRDYHALRPLLPEKSQAAIDLGLPDLDLADIAVADQLLRTIKARHPDAKLGSRSERRQSGRLFRERCLRCRRIGGVRRGQRRLQEDERSM